eukprot:Skav218260  [mRNA]  locus=scaffold2035:149289:149987:+ [translate_table: standard]
MDASCSTRVFKNLQLSYRGSERQAPSVLSLALMMSKVIQDAATEGKHDPGWNTEQRLRASITDFHSMDGTLSRWQIDEDKQKAILNLLVGTSSGSRKILTGHLNYHKWKESAFTAELLKTTRWLINACPRGCKEPFKSLLVVDAPAQEAFLANHIPHFLAVTRRMKATAKAKSRPSVQEWDEVVNYTCIMMQVRQEIETHLSDDEARREKVLQDLEDCFMARPGLRFGYNVL